MKNKIFKTITHLICICLMLTLLSPVVSAESETIWDTLVEIYAPTDGEEILFYAFAHDGACEVNDDFEYDNFIEGVRVYDITAGKYYSEEDLVIAGHQYRFEVLITPDNGYKFADYNGTPNLTARFISNGVERTYLNADVKWFPDQRSIIMSYTYVVNKREKIDNVTISVTPPADGEYPDFYNKIDTANVNLNYNYDDGEYVINGMQWGLSPTSDPFSLAQPISKDAAFEGGRTYRLVIDIVAVQDYAEGIERVFAFDKWGVVRNPDVLINGSSANTKISRYSPDSKTDAYSCLRIFKDYYCPYRKRVSEVALEIDPPMLGKHPDFTPTPAVADYKVVQNPDDVGFIRGVKWHNNKTGENMTENDVFMNDTSYSFVAYLEPIDDETIFTKDYWGNTTVTGKLNGNEADVYDGIVVNQNSSHAIAFEYRFEPLSNVLTRMAVLDIDTPLAGETPDYEATVVNDIFYNFNKSGDNGSTVINGITWKDNTEGRFLESTDTFKIGNNYSVYVDLTISEGYDVDNTTSFAINNSDVSSALGIAGTNYIRLTYSFEAVEPYQTGYNLATGIDLPQEGAYPDFTLTLENDECCVEAVRWNDVSAMAPVSMTADDKFIGGHTYQVELDIVPAENYVFETNANGNLTYEFEFEFDDVKYTANLSGDKNAITASFTFNTTPIISTDLSVDTPFPGFTPSFIAYLSNDACIVNSISWYDKTDGVYIEETDEFIQGHIYVIEADVFTVGNARFDISNDTFSATINGKKAEIDSVLYTDEESDVTTIYSMNVALRLSYTFEPCKYENVLSVEYDNHIDYLSVSHEIYTPFEDNTLAVYIAFYDSDERLVSCVMKNVEWANDIYGETVPDDAVYCKAMLWNKNSLVPLCNAADCETIKEIF